MGCPRTQVGSFVQSQIEPVKVVILLTETSKTGFLLQGDNPFYNIWHLVMGLGWKINMGLFRKASPMRSKNNLGIFLGHAVE